jgi:hypothetical protein
MGTRFFCGVVVHKRPRLERALRALSCKIPRNKFQVSR